MSPFARCLVGTNLAREWERPYRIMLSTELGGGVLVELYCQRFCLSVGRQGPQKPRVGSWDSALMRVIEAVIEGKLEKHSSD